MSLSERQVIAHIENSGNDASPAPGWQAAVFRTIHNEEQPVRLSLVPNEVRRARTSHRSLVFGGLTLAFAVLAFFLVLDQRPDDRITKRTTAIAMVVEFVGLETEMARALAEIDVTEARMDVAFLELQETLASHSQPALRSFSAEAEAPARATQPEERRLRDVPMRKVKSKKASAAAMSCGDAGDILCGL